MQKLEAGDFVDGDRMDSMSKMDDLKTDSVLDPKVTAAYKKVGVVLRSYRSGKLPKAFKIIPQTQNWEELLLLTSPETWSPNASFQATKIFVGQLNNKMAQRFFNLILLPNVQSNIAKYKKLNYHLYMAIKKAMFKTGPFFKGFLLPLAEDHMTSTREAIIIGSILQKMSINALDVAAALVKMSTYAYNLGNGYFIKVLLGKRYTLPTIVLEQLIDYFCKTGLETKKEQGMDLEEMGEEEDDLPTDMPVMWHQTVLSLVQFYKTYFTPQQKKKISALIRVQHHYAITPEIRRELAMVTK
jgi:essential nuclear protein 1